MSLTSSGGSVVEYKEEDTYVYQTFTSKEVAERIATMMSGLQQETVCRLSFQKGFGKRKEVLFQTIMRYPTFRYIVPFRGIRNRTLIWERIIPLNQVSYGLTPEFLEANQLKIWYDVAKALTSLHRVNLLHNDTVLDNIGIHGGNFVLFDFNGTGSPDEKGLAFHSDFERLARSFLFYGVDEVRMKDVKGLHSLLLAVADIRGCTLERCYRYLEALQIQYI